MQTVIAFSGPETDASKTLTLELAHLGIDQAVLLTESRLALAPGSELSDEVANELAVLQVAFAEELVGIVFRTPEKAKQHAEVLLVERAPRIMARSRKAAEKVVEPAQQPRAQSTSDATMATAKEAAAKPAPLAAAAVAPATVASASNGKYKCGVCGELGHNKRGCSKRL